MTGFAALLDRLHRLDVRLVLEGDRLSVNAPKGALSAELRDELGRCKEGLKAHLRAHPPVNGAARTGAPELIRVPRSAHMPVSHTQQRLWFLKQMDPHSSTYNITSILRMTGTLDVPALERVLADLVERHESLRTRFVVVEGAPRCSVEEEARTELKLVDVSHLPAAVREEAAVREVLATARQPFDLGRCPLLNTTLVRIDDRQHLFCFSVDHIVADGMSVSMFFMEMQALYTQYVAGKPADLPPLPVQYLDYAQWQRHSLAAGALDDHLAYWKQQLHALPPLLALPTDRPRPPVQTFNGDRKVIRIPLELATALKALARREGATLYMVLLAGFEVLLHRYSGEEDFAIGSAIAARNRPEVDRVLGFFANNIVQRADLSGDPTVHELLARVRKVALKAYAHQDMPFDLLVEAVAPRRGLDHSPLFQVLFVMHNLLITRIDMPGVACEVMELPLTTARFDLAVDVFDLADGLRIYFEYNTDLFDASTIDRIGSHYHRLLEGLVGDPQARVGSLPMLSESEQGELLGRRGPALAPPEADTVHGLFEAQVARTPSAEALRFEGRSLSYAELNARANRLARHLRELGVRSESLVGLWMDRSIEMVVALLGVLKAGAAYVPLDPAFPKERIDFMVADAALEVVVTQARLAGAILRPGLQAVTIDTDWPGIAGQSGDDLPRIASAGHLAYVIYTSGSTGKPKGVEIEHGSVVNFLRSMHREPGIAAHDRLVALTTLSFDIAGLEIHGPLTAGGTVILASRATALNGQELAALLDESRASIVQATPATWRLLLESGWRGRRGMKMLCGGEALPPELAQALLRLDGELWNLYGPTETTIWSTVGRVRDAGRSIPLGGAITETSLYVLEMSGLPAPIGVAGELCIGGAGVARGYRNRPDLTADKFNMLALPDGRQERVYRTGDLVRWRADGGLEYVGRRDQQVKLRGFRIELGEIETVLAAHPGVRQCVAAVREDTPGDQRLVAYVVPAAGAAFDAAAARAALRVHLPEYMIPGDFMCLPTLPLTPNGKVDRKALPEPVTAAPLASGPPAEALMNPTQRRVASAWRELLRTDRVGLRDNFFDLGGHSLLLVRLQAALQRDFVVDLPLVELFQRTTVEAQAERLSSTAADPGALQRALARAARQINA